MAEIVIVPADANADLGAETTGNLIQIVDQKKSADAEQQKPLTDAELEQRRKDLSEAMGWEKPAEKKPEEAAPAAPPVTAPAAAPPAPLAPVAPATPPTPPPSTPDELIAKTARETAKAVGEEMRANQPPAAAPAPAPEADQLSSEDEDTYQIVQKMEQLGTAKPGAAEAFKAFCLARYMYEDNWLAANPGKSFNPEDSDHEEFYKGQPDIDESKAEAARIEMLVDRRVEDKVSKALAPIHEKELLEEARPKIRVVVAKALSDIIATVSEPISKVATVNGQLDFSDANVAKMMDADAVAASVLEPLLLQEVAPLIMEIEKTKIPGLNYFLDPHRNPTHAAIARHASELEKNLSGTSRDGKKYITIADFNQQLDAIENGKGSKGDKNNRVKSLNDRHFIMTPDELSRHIVESVVKRAKSNIEQIEKIAQKKYKNAAPQPAAPAAAAPVPQPTATTTPKPPPSAGSQTESVDSRNPDPNAAKTFGETAVATHFGK